MLDQERSAKAGRNQLVLVLVLGLWWAQRSVQLNNVTGTRPGTLMAYTPA